MRAALRAALAVGVDEDAVRFAQSWLEGRDAAEAASEARAQLSTALLAAREALRAAASRGHPLRDLACLAPLAAAVDAAVAASLPAAEVAAAKATLRELEEASARFDAEAAEARLALEGSSRSGDPTQIEARHSSALSLPVSRPPASVPARGESSPLPSPPFFATRLRLTATPGCPASPSRLTAPPRYQGRAAPRRAGQVRRDCGARGCGVDAVRAQGAG